MFKRSLLAVGVVAALLADLAGFVGLTQNAHAGTWLTGVDVSHWNGTINWTSVAGAGIKFAIQKASDDQSYVDPTYVTNRNGAAAAGIKFTGYHFARPDSTANDAVIEADHFVDTAQLAPGDLIPALDLEMTGGLAVSALQNWTMAWLNRVTQRLGVKAMIYTSPYFWKTYLGDTQMFADEGYKTLWIAHWGVTSPSVPANNWGGNGWTFWQWTDCWNVKGISGCVDGDRFNGTDLTSVTIGALIAPKVSISTPSTITGPVVASFSEIVRPVTTSNFFVTVSGGSTPIAVILACRDGGGAVVSCATGDVVKAWLAPSSPLVPGQYYSVQLDVDGVSPLVADVDTNTVASTTQSFRASTIQEETTPAARHGWHLVTNSSAYGGSYRNEHLAGAKAFFPFTGTSITWYAVTAPSQGLAYVYIDGVLKGSYNQYASSVHYKVARTFSGLSSGGHTIQIVVRGVKGSSAGTGTYVAIDAFTAGGVLISSPSPAYVWRVGSSSAAKGGKYAITDLPETATFTFRGTGIDWYTMVGPSQGKAEMWVDGVLKATVDNYASSTSFGVRRSIRSLTDAIHTLKIVVLGTKRSTSTGRYVVIDRWVAI
jgi:GH25 family lysozyme M1 (1,4-beta-N-acetylmuramidase)